MRDVFSILHALEPELSKSEWALAELMRSDPGFIVGAGITEVAERVGVSPPTVTRFSRRLGCDSFTAFKVALAQAASAGMRYLRVDSDSHDPQDIADSLVSQSLNAIQTVREGLDLVSLQEAAHQLAHARLIATFGAGGTSSMIAQEQQNRLFRLGLHTVCVTDHAMQLMQAATLKSGDVLLASSVSGRNMPMVRALEAAKDYGARVIAMTRRGRPVSDVADLVIEIDLPEGDNILRPSASRYGFLYATDLLASYVALERKEEARESLRRIKLQLTNTRDPDDREALGD